MRKLVFTDKHECHWNYVFTFTGTKDKIRFKFGDNNYYREWETRYFDRDRLEIMLWLEMSTTHYHAEQLLNKAAAKIEKL